MKEPKKHDPYAGGMVFPPVKRLAVKMKEAEAKRNNPADPMAARYAKPEVYKELYAQALQRLTQPDMATADAMAARLSIDKKEFMRMARAGEAVLVAFEGKSYAPLWQLGPDGTIDPLKVDIAREFALEGGGFFKFLDYFKFMTEETEDISRYLHESTLKAAFAQAGVQDYQCTLSVNATMDQLANKRHGHPAYFQDMVRHLDAALIRGGWDPIGGLSRPFRNRYNVPGLTIDEQRRGGTPQTPAP